MMNRKQAHAEAIRKADRSIEIWHDAYQEASAKMQAFLVTIEDHGTMQRLESVVSRLSVDYHMWQKAEEKRAALRNIF